jgi:hypothetical protein
MRKLARMLPLRTLLSRLLQPHGKSARTRRAQTPCAAPRRQLLRPRRPRPARVPGRWRTRRLGASSGTRGSPRVPRAGRGCPKCRSGACVRGAGAPIILLLHATCVSVFMVFVLI